MNAPQVASAQWLAHFGIVLLAALAFALGPGANTAFAQSVVVNEFVAINDQGLTDVDGDFTDWIELHNPGASLPGSIAGLSTLPLVPKQKQSQKGD